MTLLTQKFSKLVFAGAIRVLTLALFLVVFGASGSFAHMAPDDQVSFTVIGTAVVTGVTKLPGGLTQVNFNVSAQATHLGDITGPWTRIQDNQGNFDATGVFIGANGKDSVFVAISGQFENTKDKCEVVSTGTYTVTGGTGAFANATGSGTTATDANLCTGTSIGTFEGTISRPNSN